MVAVGQRLRVEFDLWGPLSVLNCGLVGSLWHVCCHCFPSWCGLCCVVVVVGLLVGVWIGCGWLKVAFYIWLVEFPFEC